MIFINTCGFLLLYQSNFARYQRYLLKSMMLFQDIIKGLVCEVFVVCGYFVQVCVGGFIMFVLLGWRIGPRFFHSPKAHGSYFGSSYECEFVFPVYDSWFMPSVFKVVVGSFVHFFSIDILYCTCFSSCLVHESSTFMVYSFRLQISLCVHSSVIVFVISLRVSVICSKVFIVHMCSNQLVLNK